jgi:hypothetical protein
LSNPLSHIVMAPPPDELWIDDLADIVALHTLAHEVAPVPDLFARETPEFFKRHLEAEGRIYGLRDRSGLIAYGVLGLPEGSEYNFGAWTGLPAEHHGRVGHIDGIAVRPDHRGLNLHGVLLKRRILAALDHKRDLIYTTAAPANLASLSNLLSVGFVMVAFRQLFGGHDRYIMAWSDHAPAREAESRLVPLDDTDEQSRLLRDGFVAVGGGRKDGRPYLDFVPETAFTAPWSGLVPPSKR